jgi:hypothetical protein
MKNYGFYDTKDKVWLGDEKGPEVLNRKTLSAQITKLGGKPPADDAETFLIVRLMAEVRSKQLGYDPSRIQAREYDPAPKRLKDEVPVKDHDVLRIIKRIEGGGL